MNMLRVDADRMAALLKQEGLTIQEVAKRAGVDRETVTRLRYESYPLLSRIAARCAVNPFLLVDIDVQTGGLRVNTRAALDAIRSIGLTRDQLGEEFGIHRNTMHDATHDKFPKLNRLAKAMGVSPMALLRVDRTGE